MAGRLVVAVSGNFTDDEEPHAEIYQATSDREADRFVEGWEEFELKEAQRCGGYPGYAFVVGRDDTPKADMTAEEWLVNFVDENYVSA